MKYALSVFFVLMFTFAVSIVEAQEPRNLYKMPPDYKELVPPDKLTSVQTRCLEMGLGLGPFGECMDEWMIPWIAYGKDGVDSEKWTSIFRWTNRKMDDSAHGGVTVHLILMGLDGKSDMVDGRVTSNAYLRDNKSTSVVPISGVSYPLMPKESVEAEFMYPVSYDSGLQPSPDPNRLAVGGLWLRYTIPIGAEPENLLGLVPSSLSFMRQNPQGAYSWNATINTMKAAPYLGSQFSETFVLEDRGQDFKITSAAVANPTEQPIFVDITLHDEEGAFVATRRIFLQAKATNGFLFRELFADNAMFPRGKDFTGTVTFAVAEPGILNPGLNPLIVATVFHRFGDSMGNLQVYPVAKP